MGWPWPRAYKAQPCEPRAASGARTREGSRQLSPPLCEGSSDMGLQAEAPTDLPSNFIPLPLPPCGILSRPLSLSHLICEMGMMAQSCGAKPGQASNTIPHVKCLGEGLVQGPPSETVTTSRVVPNPGCLVGSKPSFAAAHCETRSRLPRLSVLDVIVYKISGLFPRALMKLT